MDQVMSDSAPKFGLLNRIAHSLNNGFVLVNAKGKIVWIDDKTRRRINGELQHLALPLSRLRTQAIDCFLSVAEVKINGQGLALCVLQETDEKETERDLATALHAVFADTSWITRTIVERLKAWRRQKNAANCQATDDVDALSGREREVLGLICEGRSDADMSRILQLSPNTVRNHVMSLYRKIGVNRRSAAIIWARERGITCLDVTPAKRRVRALHSAQQAR